MPTLARTSSIAAPTRLYLRTLEGRALLVLSTTGLVALCAHLSVPLPFTPVPLTLQTFAVLLIGFLLGPIMGFVSLLAYLVEGACGLPVFSPHGIGGVAQLFGPTGGYLLAYPFVAALAGLLSRTPLLRRSSFAACAIAGTAATALLFLCASSWFMLWTHSSPAAAWTAAVLPFLPGETVKVTAAAGIASALYRHRID